MALNNVLNLKFPISVSLGGLGVSSLTAYAPLFAGTTSTGPVQSGTVGVLGQVLTSNGAGALPTFQTLSGSGTVTDFIFTDGANLDGTVATSTSTPTLSIVPTSSTPAASSFASHDANVNLSSNNFLSGYTTSASTPLTLTVASSNKYYLTGTAQSITLPVVSTLTLGQTFEFVSDASTVMAIYSSGANLIQALGGNNQIIVTCISTSGTSAASWTWTAQPARGTGLAVSLGGTGLTAVPTVATASTFAAWNSSKNLFANSFLTGYTTTATAAGSTVLSFASTQEQYFTGSTTQTVTLPVASSMTLGQSFTIVNLSTGVVTVQTSGANTVQAMASNTQLVVTCILTSGTSTASWSWVYSPAQSSATPVSIGGLGVTSLTAYAPIFGGTTSTGAVQSGTAGTANQLLQSNGSSAIPTFVSTLSGLGVQGQSLVVTALGTLTTGTTTLNLATSQVYTCTITASNTITFAFSNAPASNAEAVVLRIVNGGGGTIVWPASTKFAGGVAPTLTTSGTDLLGIYYDSVTSTWMVFVIGLAVA